MELGIPVSLMTISMDGILSGVNTDSWEDDEMQWISARAPWGRSPGVALGKWAEHYGPPAAGMPGISVYVFGSQSTSITQFPLEARRIISFMERFLIPFPIREIEIFQGSGVEMRTLESGQAGVLKMQRYHLYFGENVWKNHMFDAFWGK